MSFFFRRVILFFALSIATLISFSQSVQDIKVDELYMGTLDNVLDKISNKYKVKFEFDRNLAQKIEIDTRPIELPLLSFLTNICAVNNLVYIIDTNEVIHISEKTNKQKRQTANVYSSKPKVITANSESDDVLYGEKKSESKNEIEKKVKPNPKKYNFTFSGKVRDKSSGESLPFVNIAVKGTALGATTNVDGYFTLLKVPNDTATIEFSYIGYERLSIDLEPDMPLNNLVFEMGTSTQEISGIEITAEKQDILQTNQEVGMIKLTPVKLKTLPNLGEVDIFRSLQLMPGVSAANENSSGLYVRGGTPDQSLVLYDGFTVYNVEHLMGFFSTFNSNAIKDVQLYKGGFDAKYGGRLSSVAEITGKEGNRNQFNLGCDLSLMSVNAFTEFPIKGKVTVLGSYRRSWKSPLYNKIFNQQTDESTTEQPATAGPGGMQKGTSDLTSNFYDINAKITYRPTESDIISLSFYNGADKLDKSIKPQTSSTRLSNINMTNTDITKWGNTGVSLKWSRNWNAKLYSNILISYSNYFSKRDQTTEGSFTNSAGTTVEMKRGMVENNDLYDYSTKGDFEYKLLHNNNLEFGFQITKNLIDYSFTQDDTNKIIDRSTNGMLYSFYAQDKLTFFKNKLLLSGGLRYNYYSPTNSSYFEPRFNTSFQITKLIKLKGSIGKYYQFVKRIVREDITESSRDFWVLADNSKLPVCSSIQYVAGFAVETAKFVFDVEGYYKQLDNLSEYSMRTTVRQRNISYDENFFTGTGVSKGIDFLVQKKYGKYSGWIGYTLGQVTNNFAEYGDADFYASNDVTHEFKIANSYSIGKFDFSATWIYATGKPYTAPEGGYQLTLLDGTTAYYLNASNKNALRLPDYHRLDVAATWNFHLGTAPASLSLSVFNVYNRQNIWYKQFQIMDNEIIVTDVKYLGIKPNLSFSVKLH